MSDLNPFMERLCDTHREAIRYYFAFAAIVAALGLGVIAFSFLASEQVLADALETAGKSLGVLMTLFTGYPLNEVLKRKEKIGKLMALASCNLTLTEEDFKKLFFEAYK